MSHETDKPVMDTSIDLSGQFLLAMPGMVGGVLADTIIYVCEHSAEGALGLVVNRPTDITVGDLLQRRREILERLKREGIL